MCVVRGLWHVVSAEGYCTAQAWWAIEAPPLPWVVPPAVNLQLLHGPQFVPDVRDRLDGDVLVHSLHLLRPKLRDPNPDRELLALRIQRDRGARGQRRVCRREPPAGGCQAGAHHVGAREEEADRAAVYADVWEYERICKGGFSCEDYRKTRARARVN